MTRTVPEWIGSSDDDTPVPPRVRLRVFLRDGGICQCGCGIKIRDGRVSECDHTVALTNGGENRESNLRTLLKEHHVSKTAADVAEKSKLYRRKVKRLKLGKRRTIPGRRFNGDPIPSRWV